MPARPCPRSPRTLVLVVALLGCASRSKPPECEDVVCSAGTCEVDAERSPYCVCGAWEQAANLTCEIAYFDIPELDDTPDGATLLIPPVGPFLSELGGRPGEVDFYRLVGTPGQTLRLSLEVDGGTLPKLQVSPPALRQDFAAHSTNDVWLELGDAGTYFVAVSHAETATRTPYWLGARDYGVDAPASSLPIGHQSTFAGELLIPGPVVDSYVVSAARGDVLEVQCEGGVELSAEPSAISTLGRDALRFEVVATTSEQLLRVSGAMAERYSCRADVVGHDDFPDGTDAPAALGEADLLDGTLSFEIESDGDREAVTVPVTPTHCYRLSCEPDCTVSPGRFEANGARSPPLSLNGSLGTHTVTVLDLGPDDHGDTYAEASLITPGEYERRVEAYGDVDVFALDAVDRGIYRWTCHPSGCQGWWTEANERLVDQIRWVTHIDFKVDTAKRIYLADDGYYDVDAFPVQLTLVGLDDHGDAVATASASTLNATVTTLLQHVHDRDAFTFTLSPGRYHLETQTDHLQLRTGLWSVGDGGALTPEGGGVYAVTAAGTFALTVRIETQDYSQLPTYDEPWPLTFTLRVAP